MRLMPQGSNVAGYAFGGTGLPVVVVIFYMFYAKLFRAAGYNDHLVHTLKSHARACAAQENDGAYQFLQEPFGDVRF